MSIMIGSKTIGMASAAPRPSTLPPFGQNPNDVLDLLLSKYDALQTLVEGKADIGRIKTHIAFSDEAILIQAREIALRGNVTILDIENDRSGVNGGALPPSMTRIRGGVIQTEAIISSNWSTSAGTLIDLDDGIISMGGSSAPKFHYEDGDLEITGELKAGSIIAGSVTVAGVALSTISSNAASGYSIQQALESNGSVILTGQIVPTNTGALKVGTITWNSSTGALTGGTGVAITEYGVIGASGGSATFTLNASTGAATFAGTLSAATGTFAGSISAASGTFAGSLVTSGQVIATGGWSFGGDTAAIHGSNSGSGYGVRGAGGTAGIYGTSASYGVLGSGTGSSSYGVYGTVGTGASAIGVLGQAGSFASTNGTAIAASHLHTNGVALSVSGKIVKNRVNGHLVKIYDTATHALLNTYEYSFE